MTECSQCTITLTTSTGTVIYVPMPVWDSIDGEIGKDVELFNMWKESGIELVDKGINDESFSFGGIWSVCGIFAGMCFPICFPACFSCPLTTMWNSIRTASNNDSEITIDGLGDCMNGVYVIQDFQIKTIKRAPIHYSYKFIMKKVRDL